MTIAPRPIREWIVRPTSDHPNGGVRFFVEPPTPEFLWQMLGELRQVPERGYQLFPPPLSNQKRLWKSFANFVRQAEAYWWAGAATAGSSAGLLYYYSALNLAKAELLTWRPSAVQGTLLRHGLSYRPTEAKTFPGERLRVSDGVFGLLYEKRTGLALKSGTELPVRRLFGQIPEITLELQSVGLGKPMAVPFYRVLAADEQSAWVMFAMLGGGGVLSQPRHVTARAFRRVFDQVDLALIPGWRDVFAVSRRAVWDDVTVWQTRRTFSRLEAGVSRPALGTASAHVQDELGPALSENHSREADGFLVPSMYSSRELAMPASLARYAAMFFVSSIVRYKPEALDPASQGGVSWLIDAFCRFAAQELLADALGGIYGQAVCFEAGGYRV